MKGLHIIKGRYGHSAMWEYVMGCIDIATVWFPDGRAKRTDYVVRLHFNQIRGKPDFTKDKRFENIDLATKYIEREFKKHINAIGYELGLWKNKH